MFNSIAIQSQWAEFKAFFMAGDPPLIMQLLILNTVFFIYIVVRRVRARPMRGANAINTAQFFLLGTNLLLIFQSNLFGLSWTHLARTLVGG